MKKNQFLSLLLTWTFWLGMAGLAIPPALLALLQLTGAKIHRGGSGWGGGGSYGGDSLWFHPAIILFVLVIAGGFGVAGAIVGWCIDKLVVAPAMQASNATKKDDAKYLARNFDVEIRECQSRLKELERLQANARQMEGAHLHASIRQLGIENEQIPDAEEA